MRANSYWQALAIGVVSLSLVFSSRADDLTAFNLIKEGNRYVGEGVKDKVVQIRSEKSAGRLTPDVWYVVYYDEDATFKAVEVKFEGGKKASVKRPARILEYAGRDSDTLDRKKMRVDSDRALATATGDSALSSVKLKATQLWLEHGDEGPVWKIRLWAARADDPDKETDIGDIYISADDGKVTRRDLHLERLR
jgi:hypothetical protein